jgi:2-polyprenyl-6-hydroxyphenyl methylase/3-demethylubiquinone-9 3-methyltransferase
MKGITPCLWFDGQAEEAATFYASLLPDSKVDSVNRAPADFPGGKRGDALVVEFTLLGRPFQGLNGGPQFPFTEAISLSVSTEDQAETDRLWDALIADGGSPSRCGWLKDRFGLSWQIVPLPLVKMMTDPDKEAARRATEAMLKMDRLDIAVAARAFAG